MSTTYGFGTINQSQGFVYDDRIEIATPKTSSSLSLFIQDAVYPHLTWSALWFSLLCLFIAFNTKHMPFMWHMRIVNAFRFVLRTQRPRVAPAPAHIFQPLVTTSTAQLMEIDFNLHKTNSSYFADLDVARAHLVCTLFSRGIERMRGGTEAYVFPKKGVEKKPPMFGLALGGVSCTFRRELRPYERYDMWTRVLAWDEKWLYLVTHFVRAGAAAPGPSSLYPDAQPGADGKTGGPGAAEPGKEILATALSKCVFKSGRKTVAPALMLEMSGLLPPPSSRTEETAAKANEKTAPEQQQPSTSMTPAEVEALRQQGLRTAAMLSGESQQRLEAEFGGSGCEVLGTHTDGAGVVGVVSTLMQLAHLKRSQIL